MKQIILSLALSISALVFSQHVTPLTTSLGVKVGVNPESKLGFYGGIFGNIPISSKFSIQPEVLYNRLSKKGEILPDPGGFLDNRNDNYNAEVDLNYLSVPVTLQYNISPHFYVECGPQISFLMSSRLTYKSISVSINELLRKVDFGASLGTGYYITPHIGVTARYVLGIGNIALAGPTNNTIQIGAAYKW
ncbi:PorT family protein [Chryseobacterium nematophagum]|uniref:PorT family protein n=1 Tax=Chryseobacterium nematophagum TaxID=2305228 RepID=A0A3M7TD72_9FLAO|nr:porin family protein [Chryseobacterium nematophagum]RNA61445.1 PorT family protein [Chryseobacterium nematophagum]